MLAIITDLTVHRANPRLVTGNVRGESGTFWVVVGLENGYAENDGVIFEKVSPRLSFFRRGRSRTCPSYARLRQSVILARSGLVQDYGPSGLKPKVQIFLVRLHDNLLY